MVNCRWIAPSNKEFASKLKLNPTTNPATKATTNSSSNHRKLLETPFDYPELLQDLKSLLQNAQIRAALVVSRELVLFFWSIGRRFLGRKGIEGWARRLSIDSPMLCTTGATFATTALKINVSSAATATTEIKRTNVWLENVRRIQVGYDRIPSIVSGFLPLRLSPHDGETFMQLVIDSPES